MKKKYKVKKGYVYLLQSVESPELIKYGYSKNHPYARKAYWQRALNEELKILYIALCKNPANVENAIKYATWSDHTYLAGKYKGKERCELCLTYPQLLIKEIEEYKYFIEEVKI